MRMSKPVVSTRTRPTTFALSTGSLETGGEYPDGLTASAALNAEKSSTDGTLANAGSLTARCFGPDCFVRSA